MNTELIAQFLDEQVSNDAFSGVVVVENSGTWIFQKALGFANKEINTTITTDTIFNIGSMDKMFTGVAIAQLAQEGALNFDDLVCKYVKLPDHYKTMTIDHVLTHREGCLSFFNDKYIDHRLELKTVDDYLNLFTEQPLLFEPGSKYQYSNSGYVLLGAIIEAVSEESYYDYVRKNIFKSAEMNHTGSFNFDEERIAKGYTFREPFSRRTTETIHENTGDLPYRGSPAGGGYSTAKDLLAFSKALLNHKLLNQEYTKIVTTPKVEIGTKNGQTLHYGYGFQLLDVGDGKIRIGHAGAFAGANSRLDIYPWLDTTVVVLANYDEPSAFRVANKIGDILLS